MANMNTSKTISISSMGALAKKIANTEKNMDKLLAKAGCKDPSAVKRIPIVIPLEPGSKDDVLYLGLNEANFYFKRGVSVMMPEPLLRQAVRCKVIPQHYLDMIAMIEKQQAEAAAKAAAEEAAAKEVAEKEAAAKTKTTKAKE